MTCARAKSKPRLNPLPAGPDALPAGDRQRARGARVGVQQRQPGGGAHPGDYRPVSTRDRRRRFWAAFGELGKFLPIQKSLRSGKPEVSVIPATTFQSLAPEFAAVAFRQPSMRSVRFWNNCHHPFS